MTTFMPAFESARAMPRPMPSEDAVMYAVLPATSFNGGGCETVGSGGGGGRPPGGGPPAPPAGGAFCARTFCEPRPSTVAALAPAASDPRNLRRLSASCSADRDDEEDECLLAIRALSLVVGVDASPGLSPQMARARPDAAKYVVRALARGGKRTRRAASGLRAGPMSRGGRGFV